MVAQGVADAGLGGEVQHVRKEDDVEELGEEGAIVDVVLHDEDAVAVQLQLVGALQGGS